jgi:hypothetical protein
LLCILWKIMVYEYGNYFHGMNKAAHSQPSQRSINVMTILQEMLQFE